MEVANGEKSPPLKHKLKSAFRHVQWATTQLKGEYS